MTAPTSIKMQIDGREVTTTERTTVLQAAREVGIEIPTLCHNEQLKPAGLCRLCMVEIVKGNRRRLVASCCYPAQDGLVVITETPRVRKIRKLIVELLWPSSKQFGKEYGLSRSRFVSEITDCNLCGQCVRWCSEVAKKNAVYFKGRGIDRRVAFTPDVDECDFCRQCFNLCTGGFVITEHGLAEDEAGV